jgi:hypothetical protein
MFPKITASVTVLFLVLALVGPVFAQSAGNVWPQPAPSQSYAGHTGSGSVLLVLAMWVGFAALAGAVLARQR